MEDSFPPNSLRLIFTIRPSGQNGKSIIIYLSDVCLRRHLLAIGFVYVNVLPIKSLKLVSSLSKYYMARFGRLLLLYYLEGLVSQ